MAIAKTNKPNWVLALGLPLCIFLSCYGITLSAKFATHPIIISNAILFDLLITAPLLYFIFTRKSSISKLTVSRIFIAGLLVAGLILDHKNPVLHVIKTWLSPVIEAGVLFFIGKRFYAANKKARAGKNHRVDFLLHCRGIMQQVAGSERAGNIFASEIAVLYYAFIGKRDRGVDDKLKFSAYKENALPVVLGAILSVLLIETISVHFIVSIWSKTAAWMISGLSFYTCMQLYAHIRAVKARPTMINTNSFEIHNGLAGDAYIAFDNIERIELSKKLPANPKAIKIALIKGLESHNMIVYLKQPVAVTKIFGIKRYTDTVLFFVDKPEAFLTSINTKYKYT